MPMASICTMDSRLLPLLALPASRSLSVTVFMAVNCMELVAPKISSWTMTTHSGSAVETVPKLAIISDSTRVLPMSTRR